MSDFGLFESDESTQAEPRLAARTAARKLEAAIDTVRADFGRFLLGATGIDEFEDRWHYSKADIRKAVEPLVFPNTGTMRRIQNAMKQDWKLAHPYKLAEDRDAPVVDTDETFAPSGGNLIPEGDFHGYLDSVDQGAPSQVQRDFGSGGDTGSDRHEAARLVADIYTDFARSNGLRVASLDTLDRYAATGLAQADYDLLGRMIVAACECDDDDENDESEESDSESDEAPDFGGDDDHEEPDADDEGGESDGDEDDADSDADSGEDNSDSDDDYGFGDDDEGGDEGGQTYTVPEQAPDLDPQLLNEIPHDDPQGSAPVPPEVIDSLLGLPEGTIEQLLLEEVEQGQGGDPGMSGPPMSSHYAAVDRDEDEPKTNLWGGRVCKECGGWFADNGCICDIKDRNNRNKTSMRGGDDFFGEDGGDPEQEPPRVARRRQAYNFDDYLDDYRAHNDPSMHVPQSGGGLDPWAPPGVPDHEKWVDTSGDREPNWVGEPDRKFIPREEMYRQARQFWAAPDETEEELTDRQRQQQKDSLDTQHQRWLKEKAARRFWAADDDSDSDFGSDSSGGGDSGGGQQAAPQQPGMGGGMDPSMMGGGQPMLPPPGSQSVQPPAPPQPLENQPAEDALLDTANQAIMQMIDQETQEYQQIIDPLSQALQAIQFAQSVEQAEHPLDVTPPQGSVDVSPAAAPGGAQGMQQQARRRRQGGYYEYDDNGFDPRSPHPAWTVENNTSGERSVIHAPDEESAYNQYMDGIDMSGYDEGENPGDNLYISPYQREARQAKIRTALRGAARVIASRYRLSSTGERMLLEAMGRRNYEHVREALQLVPPQVRRPAAIHMGEMFAADNPRFNKNVWMRSVLASNPRDRAGDAWRDGRDRGIAEHGRQDLEDVGYLDLHPSPGRPRTLRDRLSEGADLDWVDGDDRTASRGRLPFELAPRTAGETWTPTSTMDAFEFPHAGEVPKVDDNNKTNDLPKMKGASAQDAVSRFQRWQQRQQQSGLPTTEGEAAVHNFLQTPNPAKTQKVGPVAAGEIHRSLGLQPDAPAVPRAKPMKAVNPALSKPKAAPKTATWGEWEPARQASFFTRKVPGWRWDDHLNGYLSKEGKAFTCACGEKIAAPSYKNCDCGKIWNITALGSAQHLASDTADFYVAREVPVRPGVVMANRRMSGPGYINGIPVGDISEYLNSGATKHRQKLDAISDRYRKIWGPQPFVHPKAAEEDSDKIATRSHRELLAEIDKLADWTIYDGPDPSREGGPKKPPSTTIPSQPRDWAKRDPNGTWQGPAIPRKKK